jgi:hypothetical protein
LFTSFFVRTSLAILAIALGSAPVAECFVPPPGAEMPCCAGMHQDGACPHNQEAMQCCQAARVHDAYGLITAAPNHIVTQPAAVLSRVVAAPNVSLVPLFIPLVVDTGPPGRSTPLHVVLSVFLI